ncbi:uncharacterized protein LOC107045220 [Diachasma alloeum]|uniref:uncharacterized protein LOC107045220 n=1 Tax=Diachasma alloeum TaxID=454923 RepID=UPI0007382010|nr:uncharacterized protein LOC107045220 [Diachasma alloeum]
MINYSKNIVFECLSAGDTNVTLTGYIDHIQGRKWFRNEKKTARIFRIDDTKGIKIEVYVWEKQIMLWESHITLYKNVTITRGSIKVTPITNRGGESTLAFHLESFSEIHSQGTYNPQIRDSIESLKEIQLTFLGVYSMLQSPRRDSIEEGRGNYAVVQGDEGLPGTSTHSSKSGDGCAGGSLRLGDGGQSNGSPQCSPT